MMTLRKLLKYFVYKFNNQFKVPEWTKFWILQMKLQQQRYELPIDWTMRM